MADNAPAADPSVGGQKPPAAIVSKMSFASVAALPPKNAANQNGIAPSEKTVKSAANAAGLEKQVSISSAPAGVPVDQQLSESLAKLDVKHQSEPPSDLPEHGPLEALRQSAKLDDERTHLSVSSTKAPSLDGKSIASITTFAMDEKESIRPDDSASVQAAEDEDSNSGPGSGAQNSRFGSETGGKAFHSQLQEISLQRGIPLPRKITGASSAEPHANGIVQPMPLNAIPSTMGPQGAPMISQFSYACMPDEKLIEALEGSKDRLFLLQLEQQFITFIQDSQANSLDLPPYNSFFRLLAHRLGDYYRLSHWVDSSTNAVRLYKTNEAQCAHLPTPLSAFRRKPSTEEAQSVPQSMKIMRRAGGAPPETPAGESGGNTNVNSKVPSKAGSEAGDDSQKVSGLVSPAESTTAKDKATQTREEREAKYKEARDRIFAGWKEGDNGEGNPSNEPSAQASRASSVNGRKKKKNHKNDDDEFQARSAYNVIYPNRQAPAFDQTGNAIGYYNPYVQSNGAQSFQPGFGQNFAQQYQPMQQPPQFYPGQMLTQGPMVANTGMMMSPPGPSPGLMNYQMSSQPMMNQFYPQMQQPQGQMSFQNPMMPSPDLYNAQMSRPGSQMSDQGWSSGGLQNPYQVYPAPSSPYQSQAPQPMQQAPMQNQSNNLSMPYPYGQLPYQPHSPGNRNAHPVPGSYNRQTFNAQSRVFVPGETGYISSGNDYNARQASHASQQHGTMPVAPGMNYSVPSMPQNHLMQSIGSSNSTSPRKISTQNSQSHSPAASTISKWGTPSLPPKPPPPANQQMPQMPSSMPTFQNGTYSKPAGAA